MSLNNIETAAHEIAMPDGAVDLQWVLVLSISPVQKFIAAARRMRDLAYGSVLLSGAASALAAKLKDVKVTTVFPDPAASAKGGARCTNKIVCLLPAGAIPPNVAADMREELAGHLRAVAAKCLGQLGPFPDAVLADAFNHQLAGSLQVYCAWARVRGTSADDYAEAYRQAQRMLDARKGLRNLVAPPSRPGWQLSSLDGERDSVLADGHLPYGRSAAATPEAAQEAAERLRVRYQIDSTEQLDAMGLVKRVLGTEARFPALSRVALEPWVKRWAANDLPGDSPSPSQPLLPSLAAIARAMPALEVANRARRNGLRPGDGPASVLPYDAEVLLSSRRDLARRDLGREQASTARDNALKALDILDHQLAHEPACAGIEGVYVAVLAADGDHMGSVILEDTANEMPPALAHRRIAAALQSIADAAVTTVQQHGGCVLYAGGDDLLAVLPVQDALACAEALRSGYAQRLSAVLPAPLQPDATLSVGIGIGHVIEPMGRLLALAQDACRLAKDGPDGQGLRNALGLAVQPRSGARVQLARRWVDDTPPEAIASGAAATLVARLERWRDAFADGTVSGSLPYDLRRAVEDEPREALVGASTRLFSRRKIKRTDLLADITAHWQRCQAGGIDVDTATGALADELYLCRWLAAHPRPARPATPAEPTEIDTTGTPDSHA